MPIVGERIYLRNEHGYVQSGTYMGETSRSWLTGCEWKPSRWAKKEYSIVTKAEYDLCTWAHRNRYSIIRIIDSHMDCPPEMLYKVAELVGYKENNGK